MNTPIIIFISALTAFVISAGGSIGIAFVATGGVMPNKGVWILSMIVGLVSAGKDTRSLLKLPPVTDQTPKPPTS